MRYLTSNTRKIKAHSAVIDVILICRRGKYIVIIQSYYCSCEQKDFLDNYPSVCYTSLLRSCHLPLPSSVFAVPLHFSTGFQWDLICAFQRASQPTSSSQPFLWVFAGVVGILLKSCVALLHNFSFCTDCLTLFSSSWIVNCKLHGRRESGANANHNISRIMLQSREWSSNSQKIILVCIKHLHLLLQIKFVLSQKRDIHFEIKSASYLQIPR